MAYARWYYNGMEHAVSQLGEVEEDISHLIVWLGDLNDAVNAADKTGLVTKSYAEAYLNLLTEITRDEVCLCVGFNIIEEEAEDEDED